MKKLLLIAFVICTMISLIGVDVAYAVKPTKTPKSTKTPKPSKTPNPNKPTPSPTFSPTPQPTPQRTSEPTLTPELQAVPLFVMWLLTNGDKMCMIVSETHPSVERQQALCNWVASLAPCADYVYNDDTWSCDAFGGLRLPLHSTDGSKDLMNVWNRHLERSD